MGSGRIVDFSQPQERKGIARLQRNQSGTGPEVISKATKQEAQPIELRVHEEVVVHGREERRIRLKKDGTPDLRFRNAPTRREWERIKRLEDK